MAKKRFDDDYDGDEWYCGVVGGEMTNGECAGCDGQDYDFGECRDMADRMQGPEYDYLGHFRQKRYADEGHNDMALTEPGLPPLDVPSAGAMSPRMGAGAGMRMGPVGSAVNKAITGAVGSALGGILGL